MWYGSSLSSEEHDPYALHCFCPWCTDNRVTSAAQQKPITICHFSDWHGCWYKLPEANLYICTGDMLYNYPNPKGTTVGRREIYCQGKAVQDLGNQRERLGIPETAPLVVVRGNHDFISLVKLFGEKHTYEVGLSTTTFHNICGLKVGGFRGVNFMTGEWSDELFTPDFDKLSKALPPDLDILVTHAPPHSIMDSKNNYEGRSEHYGVRAAMTYIDRQSRTKAHLKLHCFGHVHSARGTTTQGERPYWVHFSNASEGYNLYEWDRIEMRPKTVKKLEGDGMQ